MDLTGWRLLEIGRRWWWLLLLAPVAAGMTSFAFGARQDPTYTASARIVIDPGQGEAALDYGVIQAIQYQAETYERLIELDLVLAPVIADLRLPYGIETLRDQVSGTAAHGTQLFLVTASDRDPERAAAVANGVTGRFLAYVDALAERTHTPPRAELGRQIDETRRRIDETQRRITEIEQGPDTFAPDVQPRIAALRADLELLQGSDRQLQETANRMDIDAAVRGSPAVLAAEATVPTRPEAQRIGLVGVLAAGGGFFFTAGALLLLESVAGLRRLRVDERAFAD